MTYLCYDVEEAARILGISETVLFRLSQFLKVPQAAYEEGLYVSFKGDLNFSDADIQFFKQVKERLLAGESLEAIKQRVRQEPAYGTTVIDPAAPRSEAAPASFRQNLGAAAAAGPETAYAAPVQSQAPAPPVEIFATQVRPEEGAVAASSSLKQRLQTAPAIAQSAPPAPYVIDHEPVAEPFEPIPQPLPAVASPPPLAAVPAAAETPRLQATASEPAHLRTMNSEPERLRTLETPDALAQAADADLARYKHRRPKLARVFETIAAQIKSPPEPNPASQAVSEAAAEAPAPAPEGLLSGRKPAIASFGAWKSHELGFDADEEAALSPDLTPLIPPETPIAPDVTWDQPRPAAWQTPASEPARAAVNFEPARDPSRPPAAEPVWPGDGTLDDTLRQEVRQAAPHLGEPGQVPLTQQPVASLWQSGAGPWTEILEASVAQPRGMNIRLRTAAQLLRDQSLARQQAAAAAR